MRCKKHLSDRSSSVGVCASCLRERLFALIEAQARAQQIHAQVQQSDEDHRKSDSHPHHLPPPLIFPRSVSPYICRRSDDSSWHQHQDPRFFSTPQLGPNSTITATTTATTVNFSQKKKKHSSKFNLLSNFFRSSRSDEPEHDETEQIPIPDPRVSTISRASLSTSNSSPISSTWFSSLIRRRKQQSSPSPSTNHHPRQWRNRDRGMSPNCAEEDYENYKDINNNNNAGSPSTTSGYLSESSPGWRKSSSTPAQPSRRRVQSQNNRSVSSMAFCLSPLVRASPKSHRNHQKDGLPPGFSGEIRVSSNKPNLSTAASFCANRSRKLANFGRYNYNP